MDYYSVFLAAGTRDRGTSKGRVEGEMGEK